METYAKAVLYAIPFFLILTSLEMIYGWLKNKQTYRILDTVSSLSSGLTNAIRDTLGLAVILVSYPFLEKYLAVFSISNTLLVYIIAFICMDFAGYWGHRLSHHVNYFWNTHVIHHSSEEFNMACALRQSVSNFLKVYTIFLIPAAILGLPAEVINIIAPIHLFAQFWYHTKHIGKLGFLEYIIVTPSQHRVHHAINDIYIDKNLSPVFCVWDRLFGTFQEELDEEPPVYGVLKPVRTWNPFLINFLHLWQLIKDAWHTNNWLDKFRIWFMPTGWRPEDVKEEYPIDLIENPHKLKKYDSNPSIALKLTSIFHYALHMLLLVFMLYNFGNIGFENALIYGIIIFLGIFSYTSLMDYNKLSLLFEVLRTTIALIIIYKSEDWFGLNSYITYGSLIVSIYFITSFLVNNYILFFEKKPLKHEYS